MKNITILLFTFLFCIKVNSQINYRKFNNYQEVLNQAKIENKPILLIIPNGHIRNNFENHNSIKEYLNHDFITVIANEFRDFIVINGTYFNSVGFGVVNSDNKLLLSSDNTNHLDIYENDIVKLFSNNNKFFSTRSIEECLEKSITNPNLKDFCIERAYQYTINSIENSEKYLKLFPNSKYSSSIDVSVSNFYQKMEKEKIIAENNRIENEKALVKAKKEWEIQQEKNRLASIEFEKNRKLKLKSATVGDRICFSQDWSHTESSSGFFGFGSYTNKINYKMMIICYIERIEGTKMQVRVANVESSNKNQYSTPDYKGVKMNEGTIHWVNPYTDSNWLFCE